MSAYQAMKTGTSTAQLDPDQLLAMIDQELERTGPNAHDFETSELQSLAGGRKSAFRAALKRNNSPQEGTGAAQEGTGAFSKARDPRGFPYRVLVKTGNSFGAGTDADVSIILTGDVATSPELYLKDGSNFQRNKVSKRRCNQVVRLLPA